MKYIVVCGGVLSGVGKGVIASSAGVLCKYLNLNVTSIKIDPYLNIDAGTLTPYDHGEVFVLKDGGEVDLDLGNYERFLDITLTKDHNITTGKIYKKVIENERKGLFLGKTVQVVPHITNCVQDWIERVAKIPVTEKGKIPDVCVIELGGTVGDIESAPFIEALRQFQFRVGSNNFFLIHVSYIPVIGVVGEQKTKPTQSSVKELRSLGLTPDVIACRSTDLLESSIQDKISSFCQVPNKNVLSVYDCEYTLEVPILLKKQGLLEALIDKFDVGVDYDEEYLEQWIGSINDFFSNKNESKCVEITIVGKYTSLSDSYISLTKSLQHASSFLKRKLNITWIEASHLEDKHITENEHEYNKAHLLLKKSKGILIPGGFGERGIEGMILTCQYAREKNIPYFGICLGMQVMAIEFARNVLGIHKANSVEFDENSKNPIVIYMPEISKTHLGGTMRVGSRRTNIVERNSKAYNIYNSFYIEERHRHRYEINTRYKMMFEGSGFIFSGQDVTGKRMEISELVGRDFFMGVQYHPEYISGINRPSSIFVEFIKSVIYSGGE
jgi:CTP synthase